MNVLKPRSSPVPFGNAALVPAPLRSFQPSAKVENVFRTSVSWILTGGTLSMVADNGVRKNPNANRLLETISVSKNFEIENVKLFSEGIDSSQILTDDVEVIVDSVRAILKKGRIPLITHGTDSLATTGSILSQIFPDQLIVMTAAFHPIGEEHSDAEENVKAAFLVAESANNRRIPKVPYAVLNGKVYLASSLVKLDIECNDRRGFNSYNGAVAILDGKKMIWDSGFLKNFEEERKSTLEKTKKLRDSIFKSIDDGRFRLAPIEMGFVNQNTPVFYLHSMLNRLETRKSCGLVLYGQLRDHDDILDRILILKKDFPIFVERAPAASDRRFSWLQMSENIQPGQAWSKIAVVASVLMNQMQRASFMKLNLAGEYSKESIPDDFTSEFIEENFYETPSASRAFLTYFQNLPLFREALIGEILRLNELKNGKTLELIIEGLGNGHIYVGGNYIPDFLKKTDGDSLVEKLNAAGSILNILEVAKEIGIKVTIIAAPRDAIPNGAYDVGQKLMTVGAEFAALPGRQYLKEASKE